VTEMGAEEASFSTGLREERWHALLHSPSRQGDGRWCKVQVGSVKAK
jgi:hypothetical protein